MYKKKYLKQKISTKVYRIFPRFVLVRRIYVVSVCLKRRGRLKYQRGKQTTIEIKKGFA